MLREAARDFLSAEETPPHLLLPWVSRGPFLFVTQPGRGSGAVPALTRKEQSMSIPSERAAASPEGMDRSESHHQAGTRCCAAHLVVTQSPSNVGMREVAPGLRWD